MNLGLRGKVALVTGSSRGLGKVIIETLAAEGADIIVNGRDQDEIIKTLLKIKLRFKGQSKYICPVDAANTEEVEKFFKDSWQLKKLDILVNNVGNIEKTGGFFELKDEDWFRAFNLSFMSVVRFSRAAYPWLKQSGHGRIINISSMAAIQPNINATYWHYAAAKNAVHVLNKMMANEFGKDGITVNTICPGTLKGGGWHENVKRRAKRESITEEEAALRTEHENKKSSPLGKIGQLEDVANFVAYLASDQARFITGQTHYVDGGIMRSVR